MSELYESVAEVFSARFRIGRDRVRPEATFDDLGLDSLSQIELATALQKRFGIEFTDDEIAEMSVVSEIVGLLQQKGVTV